MRGFIYDGGEYAKLPDFDQYTEYMFAGGINNQGQIVGSDVGWCCSAAMFLYEKGDFVTINLPTSIIYEVLHGQWASGINSRGEIIGSYDDNLGGHGFLAVPDKKK